MDTTFYFKINLNKYGEMRLQAEREKKIFINSIVTFAVGFIIIIVAWIYINGMMKTRVETRQRYYKELQKELASYETSEDYLSSRDLDKLAETFNNRIFWAKKMIAIRNEIDEKLAVRKFTYTNGVLTLNGITEIDKNIKELDLIQSFIDRLKSNTEISNDFPRIKSGSITRQVVKDTDILEFVIECYSRETIGGVGR
jgi:Tfp pilus assembly protein PilN